MGLMLAMELEAADVAKALVSELLVQGFVINRTHETVLRFLPPYIIQTGQVDELISALERALTKLENPSLQAPRRNSSKTVRSR